MKIPFNKPYFCGKEYDLIKEALENLKLSGNGHFTALCHSFFQKKFGFKNVLLTTSCTDALEMSAILSNIEPGDEVIIPSYTFTSTANAFILRGAKIVFADSSIDSPNIDANRIDELITPKTKVIVIVHYAGVACDIEKILEITKKYNLILIEDAAHSFDSYYKNKPLGSFGDFGTFSFHETKNISSGEGGLICINNDKFKERSEIIWEKGTNRVAFSRHEISKYEWVDIGSSYLPSEVTAAILLAQLESYETIQTVRKNIWDKYFYALQDLVYTNKIKLPIIPEFATNNGHLFYIVCKSQAERIALSDFLLTKDILSIFHYLPLHCSPFFKKQYKGLELKNAQMFSDCLLRLPLFCTLLDDEIYFIVDQIKAFYKL